MLPVISGSSKKEGQTLVSIYYVNSYMWKQFGNYNRKNIRRPKTESIQLHRHGNERHISNMPKLKEYRLYYQVYEYADGNCLLKQKYRSCLI